MLVFEASRSDNTCGEGERVGWCDAAHPHHQHLHQTVKPGTATLREASLKVWNRRQLTSSSTPGDSKADCVASMACHKLMLSYTLETEAGVCARETDQHKEQMRGSVRVVDPQLRLLQCLFHTKDDLLGTVFHCAFCLHGPLWVESPSEACVGSRGGISRCVTRGESAFTSDSHTLMTCC